MTVTGKTIAENLKDMKFPTDQDVIRTDHQAAVADRRRRRPARATWRPEGAIVKVAGMQNQVFSGPARCFDCEEDAFEAVARARLQGRRGHRHPL